MIQKLIVEFLGTFFLVLTIAMTVIAPGAAGDMAPVAIACALMVMIFAGGHRSGAHYNPAVTIAVWLRGKCPTSEVPGYIAAQIVGGIAASMCALYLKTGAVVAAAAIAPGQVFVAELLFTFALVYVVLNVATAKGTSGNSFYGLAIGCTVLAGAYSVGSISGGHFNPAVTVATCVLGLSSYGSIAIYFGAQALAAVCGAMVFRFLDGVEG